MKTIWKYQLEIEDSQSINMPIGAKILDVQSQNGVICMWFLVETNNEIHTRNFAIVGTGNPIWMKEYDYIGTTQTRQGVLVWHIFEYYGE